MFNAFLKFIDKEVPNHMIHYKQSNTLGNELLRNSLLSTTRYVNNSEETVTEKIGRGLYERGMQQKAKRQREVKEANERKLREEVSHLRPKPKISAISKEIAKELKWGDVITENKKWLIEKNARMNMKQTEKEIEENEHYKGKKWSRLPNQSRQKEVSAAKSLNKSPIMSQKSSFIAYLS